MAIIRKQGYRNRSAHQHRSAQAHPAKKSEGDNPVNTSIPVMNSCWPIPQAEVAQLEWRSRAFFTRTLVILKGNAGHTGVGEVPAACGF